MGERAEGTITFLFTDIEGSTRLLDQLRDEYGAVLAEHQRLLREAFAAHGGREIDTQGDAFFVAFDTPRDAVLAAIDGQRKLAEHAWPDGTRVRVRIGMDTGRAAFALDRYTGHAVHRAARVSAAGHGGQILVSDESEQLLGERDGFTLRDLGRKRLKDISGRVRIFQVEAPGLERSFPRLKTLDVEHRRRRRLFAALAAAAVAVAGAFAYVVTRPAPVTVPANSVGVIGPRKNRVLRGPISVGSLPGSIAADQTSVWVANLGDGTVSRIDPFSKAVQKIIPARGTPDAVAVSLGAVWVFHGLVGTVSRIDPDVNRVAQTIAVSGHSLGGGGGSLAIGAGAVWAIASDATVAKLDPKGGRVVATDVAGRAPRGAAYGAGALWVSNHSENNVYRFDPKSFGQVSPVRPCGRAPSARCSIDVGKGPSGIAVGGGYLWVANTDDDTVTRIDARTSETTSIDVGDAPTGVAYGAGAVWVANGGSGTVSRIDPASGKVKATVHVGNTPAGMVVTNDLVWVTVDAG